jgi:hypothetical protein
MVGRFTGTATLGFGIGLMVVLVEVRSRRAWLEVRYGTLARSWLGGRP